MDHPNGRKTCVVVSGFSPFINILKELKDTSVFCAFPAQWAKQLADLELPVASLVDLADNDLRTLASLEAAKLLRSLTGVKTSVHPSIKKFMDDDLPGFLYPKLTDLSLMVLVLDKLLGVKDFSKVVVVEHNDVEPVTRLMALWAKERGVPCLHVPHAVYLPTPDRGNLGGDVHDLVTASQAVSAGPYQTQWFADRGMKAQETGLPQFDKWAKYLNTPDAGRRERACRLLRMDPGVPLVVYASSWRQDTNLLGCHNGVEESYMAFLSAARAMPELSYLIKVHPSSGSTDWHIQMAQQAQVKCAVTDLHLETILQAADVLICYSVSGIMLEAAHFPIRLLSVSGFDDDADIRTVNPDPADIAAQIRDCLLDQARPAYGVLSRYLAPPDGKSFQRVANAVRSL